MPPGSNHLREVACLEAEVDNLIVYLLRRGYSQISVVEEIVLRREVRGELW